MTPFSERAGPFLRGPSHEHVRRRAHCNLSAGAPLAAWLAARLARQSRRRLFSTDAERFFMRPRAPPRARFMIWLRSEILISQKSRRAQHSNLWYSVCFSSIIVFCLQTPARFYSLGNAIFYSSRLRRWNKISMCSEWVCHSIFLYAWHPTTSIASSFLSAF